MYQNISQDFRRIIIPAKDKELNIYLAPSPLKLYSYSRDAQAKKSKYETAFKEKEQHSEIAKAGDTSIFLSAYGGEYLLGVYDSEEIARTVLTRLSNYLGEDSLTFNDDRSFLVMGSFIMPDFFGISQAEIYRGRLYRSAADISLIGRKD